MAIKLTAKQAAEYAKLASDVRVARCDLEDSIGSFNEELEKAFSAVQHASVVYNEAADAVRTFLSDLVDGWRDEWNDKSEGWQDGEKGEAASLFINEIEQFADGIEPVEVDQPDQMETPEFPDIEDLPAPVLAGR